MSIEGDVVGTTPRISYRPVSSVRAMAGLKQSQAFTIADAPLAAIRRDFSAGRASQHEAADTIRDLYDTTGMLIDPHTASGVHVARQHEGDGAVMVTLATAHPAKFPDAVKSASGIDPALPSWLSDLMTREERFATLASDAEAVKDHILAHARAAKPESGK
jgi:threonine synthase